jgi:hypothetical protein
MPPLRKGPFKGKGVTRGHIIDCLSRMEVVLNKPGVLPPVACHHKRDWQRSGLKLVGRRPNPARDELKAVRQVGTVASTTRPWG